MSKKIDAAALLEAIRDDDLIGSVAFKRIKQHIEEAPDVERRGQWEEVKYIGGFLSPYSHTCKACGYSYNDHRAWNPKFCCECGSNNKEAHENGN